jgi:hypothetical protein
VRPGPAAGGVAAATRRRVPFAAAGVAGSLRARLRDAPTTTPGTGPVGEGS